MANEHAGECLTDGPAASAAQGPCVSSRRVALMETVDDPIGQKNPTGSQAAFVAIGQPTTSAMPASGRVVGRGQMQGCEESR